MAGRMAIRRPPNESSSIHQPTVVDTQGNRIEGVPTALPRHPQEAPPHFDLHAVRSSNSHYQEGAPGTQPHWAPTNTQPIMFINGRRMTLQIMRRKRRLGRHFTYINGCVTCGRPDTPSRQASEVVPWRMQHTCQGYASGDRDERSKRLPLPAQFPSGFPPEGRRLESYNAQANPRGELGPALPWQCRRAMRPLPPYLARAAHPLTPSSPPSLAAKPRRCAASSSSRTSSGPRAGEPWLRRPGGVS